MTWTSDVVQRALELYRAGNTERQISKALGVPRTTIAGWRRMYNVPTHGNRPLRLPYEERRRTVELYLSGMSTKDIAKELGRSRTTIQERLNKAGIVLRSRSESTKLGIERRS